MRVRADDQLPRLGTAGFEQTLMPDPLIHLEDGDAVLARIAAGAILQRQRFGAGARVVVVEREHKPARVVRCAGCTAVELLQIVERHRHGAVGAEGQVGPANDQIPGANLARGGARKELFCQSLWVHRASIGLTAARRKAI